MVSRVSADKIKEREHEQRERGFDQANLCTDTRNIDFKERNERRWTKAASKCHVVHIKQK